MSATPGGRSAGPGQGRPEWGEPRSRSVEWWDPMQIVAGSAGRSGLELMTAGMRGELPPAPIGSLLHMALVEVEIGRVVFTCDPDESVYNPIGVVHGGLVCTLADSAAGCAVHTTLPAGVAYTSIDISVRYLRAVTLDSGTLRATGTVVKPGRRVATAAVEVVDGAGKLVATATSSCLVIGG